MQDLVEYLRSTLGSYTTHFTVATVSGVNQTAVCGGVIDYRLWGKHLSAHSSTSSRCYLDRI